MFNIIYVLTECEQHEKQRLLPLVCSVQYSVQCTVYTCTILCSASVREEALPDADQSRLRPDAVPVVEVDVLPLDGPHQPVSQDVHGVCDTHPPARLVSALVAVVVTELCKVLQEVRPVSCLAPVDGEESLQSHVVDGPAASHSTLRHEAPLVSPVVCP